jgi:uncharacterized damage-inducible protein DinB
VNANNIARVISWLALAVRLSDEEVQVEWTWPENPQGETLEVRSALYALLEREQNAAATSTHNTYAAAQMSLAQAAFGDLRGLLAGLDDELLDASLAQGEWTIRQTLKHVLEVELSYRANIEWAVSRKDSEPVRRPDSLGPKPEETVVDGGLLLILDRLAAARARSDASLWETKDDLLSRPSIWAGHNVDVAFRLRRFASHVVEHTVQVEKALDSLGVRLGEARRIARRISAIRGLHERSTGHDGLAALDDQAVAWISKFGHP